MPNMSSCRSACFCRLYYEANATVVDFITKQTLRNVVVDLYYEANATERNTPTEGPLQALTTTRASTGGLSHPVVVVHFITEQTLRKITRLWTLAGLEHKTRADNAYMWASSCRSACAELKSSSASPLLSRRRSGHALPPRARSRR